MYNNVSVATSHRHLGIVLGESLSFESHLRIILSNVNKPIGILRKLHNILPRSVPLTMCKDFVRIHLHYDDIIYDQASNATFHQTLEQIQYNAYFEMI